MFGANEFGIAARVLMQVPAGLTLQLEPTLDSAIPFRHTTASQASLFPGSPVQRRGSPVKMRRANPLGEVFMGPEMDWPRQSYDLPSPTAMKLPGGRPVSPSFWYQAPELELASQLSSPKALPLQAMSPKPGQYSPFLLSSSPRPVQPQAVGPKDFLPEPPAAGGPDLQPAALPPAEAV